MARARSCPAQPRARRARTAAEGATWENCSAKKKPGRSRASFLARALLLGFVALRLGGLGVVGLRLALGLGLLLALGFGFLLALGGLLVHFLGLGRGRRGRVRLRRLREGRQRERRGNEGNDEFLQHKRESPSLW